MGSTAAEISHLLRRATLAPDPRRTERLMKMDWDAAVSELLNADPGPAAPEGSAAEDWNATVVWWIDQMTRPDAGVSERMTWFWHGHLTTNAYSVNNDQQVAEQLALLRVHGMGNFRQLLHAFVINGALLQYLDADGSDAYNPNENLARELMELFTIGPGNYTEFDVKAAARALAGWEVDYDTSEVIFRRERAFIAPLMFLGEQANWDTTMVVDALCDHPATAARVSAALWYELVGETLDAAAATKLGEWWADENLEIRPLVDRILRSEEFRAARFSRPRTALEFVCAVRVLVDAEDIDPWRMEAMGQSPFLPPSVAGWPKGEYWLRPGSLMQRLWYVADLQMDGVRAARWTTAAILTRCGISDASETTRAAIETARHHPDLSEEDQRHVAWRLALTSPEFQLQ